MVSGKRNRCHHLKKQKDKIEEKRARNDQDKKIT